MIKKAIFSVVIATSLLASAQITMSGKVVTSGTVAAGTSGGAFPAGNPLNGGPQPSVIPYESYNQWSIYDNPGDYTFEVTKTAAGHGASQAPGLLTAKSTFYQVEYWLYETQIKTDPEIADLVSYCTNTLGVQPENAFLHYDDGATNTTLSDGLVITSCNGASPCPSSSRVQSVLWGSTNDHRYIFNHGDTTCFQPYMKHKLLAEVTNTCSGCSAGQHFRGLFYDEMGNPNYNCTVGGDQNSCSPLSATTAGGTIKEFAASAQTVITNGTYYTNLANSMAAVENYLLANTSNDAFTFPNISGTSTLNAAIGATVNAASGGLTEFLDTDQMGNFGTQQLGAWLSAENVNGKIFIWTEGDPNAPPPSATAGTYTGCTYHNTAADRHINWSLGNYWMIKNGNYTWYSQYARGSAVTGWTSIVGNGTTATMTFPSWHGFTTVGGKFKIHAGTNWAGTIQTIASIPDNTHITFTSAVNATDGSCSGNQVCYDPTLKAAWYAEQEYNLGTPDTSGTHSTACSSRGADAAAITACQAGNRYRVVISGTDSLGAGYDLWRRDYTNGFVLSVQPLSSYAHSTTYNATISSYSLGGTYHVLQGDGSLSASTWTSVSPCVPQNLVLVP